jgi:nicotinate-nucleotide pyrophosphorylase (carboxylating)
MTFMNLLMKGMEADYARFFAEDDLQGNAFYLEKLPSEIVPCVLKIKSELVLSGLPYFVRAFNYLGAKLSTDDFAIHEGKHFSAGAVISFSLPFSVALTGERVALNLLQRASAVSTLTSQFVKKSEGIKILDTRKTTPGLRSLEKYAVRVGGGHNHRFTQSDVWMIKDNHKNYFGGLKQAFDFFMGMQTAYQPIVAEIHSLSEFNEATTLGIKHVMLDNFSVEQIRDAIKIKPAGMTIEISGGVTLTNIENYFIKGIDLISIGALTHSAPHVDLSMKILPLGRKL